MGVKHVPLSVSFGRTTVHSLGLCNAKTTYVLLRLQPLVTSVTVRLLACLLMYYGIYCVISLDSVYSILFLTFQVDTPGELDMKYNLHQCYVHLKQFAEAIQTVRYLVNCSFV